VLGGQQQVYYADTLNDENTPPSLRRAAHVIGNFSDLLTPLSWEGRGVGMMTITREPNANFSDKERSLLRTFADQAVIAIENARLFNETQEALERQTATADILNVISNSVAETQPVFDEILRSVARLFGSQENFIFLVGEDDLLHVGAGSGPRVEQVRGLFPTPLEGTVSQVAIRERRLVSSADVFNDPELPLAAREGYRRLGENYAMVVAPMLWEDRAIGTIMVARTSMTPFSEKECTLLRTFADQAVIAIQNARLFKETNEALERQTATADILKVIASSPDDVKPVFQAIAERSNHLVGGFATTVVSIIDEVVHLSAYTSTTPAADAALNAFYPRPLSGFTYSDAVRRGEIHRIVDTEVELAGQPDQLTMVRQRGWRSALWVPLLLEGKAIGVVGVTRVEPGPFADHHVEMLKTFADQAVIAISNVGLFEQVRQRTRDLAESLQQQTATADVLKVISRSAFDLATVMNTLARSASELCEADRGALFLREDDHLVLRGRSEMEVDEELTESLRDAPVQIDSETHMGRAVLNGTVANIGDFENDPNTRLRTFQKAFGFKSFLAVPLMREGRGVGVFTLTRSRVGTFSQRQIDLVQTFADQAVIAIENVRLFDEVQARTRELAQSLDDLRTAQDRLVQTEKLASLGQLTAGIAHEIKNPLNFVNNFSALSAELTDELNDLLRPAPLDDKMRQDVDELTGLIKDNLEKVVQHGKRADSIVKNMLLHSREGSGEQRPTDINALLDESLNLAYHGARAEKPGFNITLQRDFDEGAGSVEAFPQEITRAFLNLISNGFYAATKRHADNGEANFEPLLSATTKDLGNHVEIRIRDNGIGIPPEVKEKMFNPFFTTKPAGEGTGLGLSMSHDIIVKQHGGKIDVATEPGAFTEFTIVLPRTIRN
jgi:two-component system NtrC family sensor kinase